METIETRLAAIRKKIPGVRIMAVTKLQPLEKVREALTAGVDLLGVNYVQEGEGHQAALAGEKVEWHFIGHIQSRKVKFLTAYDCVQSIDRLEIATDLEVRAETAEKKQAILVEVNIGEEHNKSGIAPSEVGAFLRPLKQLHSIEVKGLMVMPPPLPNIEDRRPFFRKAHELYRQYSNEFPFTTLSMGTSEDYTVAAEEGSTLVRLGTVLMGARPT